MNKAKFYKVMSHSNPDIIYTVRLLGDGHWACDCPKQVFAKKRDPYCKHIQEVIDSLKIPLDRD